MIPTPEELDELYTTTPLKVGNGNEEIELFLRRRKPHHDSKPAVLILHGGNTNAHIFSLPGTGLAGYLHRHFDVWLLDWRGSTRVLRPLLKSGKIIGGSVPAEREVFTLDRAAQEDLPMAIAHIRSQIRADLPISVIGYCLSSGVVSMATARGLLDARVKNLVLLTLGLFFSVPWNGWIKSEDYLLERGLDSDRDHSRVVDPNDPTSWPAGLRAAYDSWPARFLPDIDQGNNDMLRRLSFMVGQPWSTQKLAPSLHGNVRAYFGPFHLGFYLHCGQIVRRGYAAPFNAPETPMPGRGDGNVDGTDLCTRHFDDKTVTIISAQNNGVWHRESADRMYDWLRSHTKARCKKEVVAGYNLHELLWGANAETHVFGAIARGLQT